MIRGDEWADEWVGQSHCWFDVDDQIVAELVRVIDELFDQVGLSFAQTDVRVGPDKHDRLIMRERSDFGNRDIRDLIIINPHDGCIPAFDGIGDDAHFAIPDTPFGFRVEKPDDVNHVLWESQCLIDMFHVVLPCTQPMQ